MNIASGLPIQTKDISGLKDLAKSKSLKNDSAEASKKSPVSLFSANDDKPEVSKQEKQSFAEKLDKAQGQEKSQPQEKSQSHDMVAKDNAGSDAVTNKDGVRGRSNLDKGMKSQPEKVQDLQSQAIKEASAEEDSIVDSGLVKKLAAKNSKADQSMVLAPLTKQEAMQAFLGKMQSELGVEPDDVVQAFAKMDVDMLMASPEASAEQFVDNLELNPNDRDKAMLLYSELLTWRSTADLSEKLQKQGQNAEMSVLSQEQVEKRDRLENLSHLSDRFFMMGDYGRGAKLANMPKAMKAYGQPNLEPSMNAPQNPAGQVDQKNQDLMKNDSQSSAMNMSTFDMAQGLEKAGGLKSSQIPLGMKSAGQIDVTAMGLQSVDVPSATSLKGFEAAGDSTSGDGLGANSFEKALEGLQLDAADDSEDADADATEIGADDLKGQIETKLEKTSETPKTFHVNPPNPSDLDMSENIRDVIRGAQTMVKNGGGEMKIKMSPEGMGELNLKVMVQNGEVKVEMVTSSEETKKLLEKGLSELKQSLSAHKLNVEHLKIETAQKASEQMLQDRQESADRGFQQRFLQDFRDQNTSRRFQAMGVASARGMSSQTTDPASNDFDVSKKKRLERRLDLVA